MLVLGLGALLLAGGVYVSTEPQRVDFSEVEPSFAGFYFATTSAFG